MDYNPQFKELSSSAGQREKRKKENPKENGKDTGKVEQRKKTRTECRKVFCGRSHRCLP